MVRAVKRSFVCCFGRRCVTRPITMASFPALTTILWPADLHDPEKLFHLAQMAAPMSQEVFKMVMTAARCLAASSRPAPARFSVLPSSQLIAWRPQILALLHQDVSPVAIVAMLKDVA